MFSSNSKLIAGSHWNESKEERTGLPGREGHWRPAAASIAASATITPTAAITAAAVGPSTSIAAGAAVTSGRTVPVEPAVAATARIVGARRTVVTRCAALPLPTQRDPADDKGAGHHDQRQQFFLRGHNSPLTIPGLCTAQLFPKLLD